jgi:hypothetical protein
MRVMNAMELLEDNLRLCTIKLAQARWQMLRGDTTREDREKLLDYANALYMEQLRLIAAGEGLMGSLLHRGMLLEACGTA